MLQKLTVGLLCFFCFLTESLAGNWNKDKTVLGSELFSLTHGEQDVKNGFKVIADPTGEAPSATVEQFVLRDGDCRGLDCTTDRERVELIERRTGADDGAIDGSSFWYGWSLYLPDDFDDLWPTRTRLGQFKEAPSSGGGKPVFMFAVKRGGLYIEDGTGSGLKIFELSDLLGKWTKFEVFIKWSKRSGAVAIYINDEPVFNVSGRPSLIEAERGRMQYGIYRAGISNYKSAHKTNTLPTQSVYYSNVKIGATRESIN